MDKKKQIEAVLELTTSKILTKEESISAIDKIYAEKHTDTETKKATYTDAETKKATYRKTRQDSTFYLEAMKTTKYLMDTTKKSLKHCLDIALNRSAGGTDYINYKKYLKDIGEKDIVLIRPKRHYTRRKTKRNHKKWRRKEIKILRELFNQNKSYKKIGKVLGRTEGSVAVEISKLKKRGAF